MRDRPGEIGLLRFNFGQPGDTRRLRDISCAEWLAAFDERGLVFAYQEHRRDGNISNYFRLDDKSGLEAE
jgi:hypothetical protein